ncbi:NACHT, LRR and PYD domains-containing protein 1 homolog [Sardina pilchardus]|uniref:NACHT, LRR and PYD domains-containing protein 1 homolog n=1 Tax=Sardina pilchardus TaxID=27697 RepID=UPI002E1134D3
MEPISAILSPILEIALKVYKLCQQVKSNKKRCARLSKRVSLLVELLEAAREQDLCDETRLVRRALTELGEVLHTARELAQAHVEACWIERMWNAEEMGQQFDPLNVRLSQAADTLALALQVEHRDRLEEVYNELRRQKEDEEDRRADLEEWQTIMQTLATSTKEGVDAVRETVDSTQRDINDVQDKLEQTQKDIHDIKGMLETELSELIDQYKESVRSAYGVFEEYNSLPGENLQLEERYTELLIVQRHRQQREREEEIRSRGQDFQRVYSARKTQAYRSTSVGQLLGAQGHAAAPKAVILQGNSGSGKTFTTRKIMLDWASGKLYDGVFDFVFRLKCKELNCYSGEKSMVEILSTSEKLTPAVSQVLRTAPERVLVIADGFDELKFSLDAASASLPTDVLSPAPVEATLSALFSGKVLSDSALMVTTRSTASDGLRKLLKHPHHFNEILGFSDDAVRTYFRRYFKDDERLARRAFECVRANETLYTACFIPVICWIICTVLRERLEDGQDVTSGLETTTAIFVHFVTTLLEHHCRDLHRSPEVLLSSIGRLAKNGIERQQVLFDERSVSEAVSDPGSVPFLCKFLKKKIGRLQTMFTFMHLSFQEFFAALHYLLLDEAEAESKMDELLLSVEGQGDGARQSHLRPVVQFIFGLLNRDVGDTLSDAFSIGSSAADVLRGRLERWIPHMVELEKSNVTPEGNLQLFLLHCLYEHHKDEYTAATMDFWGRLDLSSLPLNNTDCWVLLYCLRCCPIVGRLKLRHSNITPSKLRMLQPGLIRCENLNLEVEALTDSDVADLAGALGEGKTLTLWTTDSQLSESGVEKVLCALAKQTRVNAYLSLGVLTAGTLKHLVHYVQNAKGRATVRVVRNQVEEEDYLSWYLTVKTTLNSNRFSLTLVASSHCGFVQSVSVGPISELSLSLDRASDLSSFQWTDVLQRSHTLWLTEKEADLPAHVAGLMSCLALVPGLKGVQLEVHPRRVHPCWATGVLALMHACPTLDNIKLSGGQFAYGLLTEESLDLLHDSEKRGDCKLVIKGAKCTKTTDQCTENSPQVSCNQRVTILIQGHSYTESPRASKGAFSNDPRSLVLRKLARTMS